LAYVLNNVYYVSHIQKQPTLSPVIFKPRKDLPMCDTVKRVFIYSLGLTRSS